MSRINTSRNLNTREWIDRAPRYSPMKDEDSHMEFLVITGNIQRGHGWYEDVSSTGFRFHCNKPTELVPGDELQVLMPTPGGTEKFTARAIVQRVIEKNHEFALAFIDLSDSQKKLLDSKVRFALHHIGDMVKARLFHEISEWWQENRMMAALILGALTLVFWSFYLLSKPIGHYSKTEKYQWGTRFESNRAPSWLPDNNSSSKRPFGSPE